MSREPIRWKDAADAPDGLRDLLRTASDLGPMPENVRAALLASLPEGAAASTTAATSGEAPSPGTTATTTGKGLLGATVVAGAAIIVAIGAALVGIDSPSSVTQVPTATLVPTATIASANTATVSASTEPASPLAPSSAEMPPSADPSASPPAPSSSIPRGSAKKPAPASDLATENALVGRARVRLASDPAAALAVIDEHARRFPRGELAPEREYLRVSALRRLHRSDEARTRALGYLATYPESPHTAAVRAILADVGSP